MVQTDLDRIEAYAVVEHLSGYLCLSALQCNHKGIMKMEALLSAVWRRAAETEYRRRKLIIHTINEDSYRFVRFLLPEAKEISHTMEREIL